MSRSVYIIGSKGIPAKYGGFETFVEKLVTNQKNRELQYNIACLRENSLKSGIEDDFFTFKGANCFNIDVPKIGASKAVLYDILALRKAIEISKAKKDINPIFYILACRIGPFISIYKKKIKDINGSLFVNPDGHEWLREKWIKPIRLYWKYSEKLMVKKSDLMVCDSKNIEKYVQSQYSTYNPRTTYIAYGTDLNKSNYAYNDDIVRNWYREKGVVEMDYYLVVGRFVPENNYESMLKEFMKSKTKKKFVLITNVEHNKFYERLKKVTDFENDKRIIFVGTVYNQDLLKYIRENAFAYFHGHEVGGTNPSLLESLMSTKVNLLLDIGFNKEVAGNSAIYWNKTNLNTKISEVENKTAQEISNLDKLSSDCIKKNFTWDIIVDKYEKLFLRWSS
ncbi:beta 1-4 rhamnosyltransferase Cps2T [Enterococcus casseliflavus]|uniref:beta 1-4 rhamnosyltransferase Cps2T n=1 Tax=Enterococcus casseliflavus TaxID=37734 RepID=UPI003D13D3A8